MKRTLTCIIALVAISSIAFAQQGGGGQRGQGQGQRQGGQNQGQGGGNGAARLLAMPSVQSELNLTSDQKSMLSELVSQRGRGGQGGGQRGQGGSSGQEQDRGANRTAQADVEKKIAEILDDKQEARLAELVIQRAGNRAVLDEKVATCQSRWWRSARSRGRSRSGPGYSRENGKGT